MELAVNMRGITKRFGRVVANFQVDFEVRRAEIHALVGENGAGKSTLMNILYGMHLPTEGETEIFGKKANMHNALDAIDLGIGMVHQHFMLIPRFTVAQNIVLGREPKKSLFYDAQRAVRQVEEVCSAFSLTVDPTAKVKDISLGMQQRVEIVKTLYRGAEIIILDEPTAVLTPQEIDELGHILKKLKGMGKTVIIITHKIEEVMNFSDRVTVLRHGKKVGTVNTGETSPQEITRMMVERDVSLGAEKGQVRFDETVLELKDVCCHSGKKLLLENINLQLRRGEILGISGIDGSGQTELAEIVCGVRRASSGSILYKGEEISRLRISQRKSRGISFVPQDRHRDGLALATSVANNLVLGQQRSPQFRGRGPIMDYAAVKRNALEKIKTYDIRTADETQTAATLSGGNQQKIIIAREVGCDPELLVADQPTRGVDIAAIELIHNIIAEKRNNGCGVLLVSLELDELLQLSDRIAVLNQGRLAGILDAATATREEIGVLMLGGCRSEEGKNSDESA